MSHTNVSFFGTIQIHIAGSYMTKENVTFFAFWQNITCNISVNETITNILYSLKCSNKYSNNFLADTVFEVPRPKINFTPAFK